MNRDRIEGSWKQFSGRVLEQWSTLFGNESGINAAKRTRHAGEIQVRRGISKAETERQFKDFLHRNRDWDTSSR